MEVVSSGQKARNHPASCWVVLRLCISRFQFVVRGTASSRHICMWTGLVELTPKQRYSGYTRSITLCRRWPVRWAWNGSVHRVANCITLCEVTLEDLLFCGWRDTSLNANHPKFQQNIGLEGAGLVPWVGGLPDASFAFYLEKHSKTRPTQKRYYLQESLGTDML